MGAAAALLRALLLLGGPRLAPTLGLLQDHPTVYEGPPGSYFGFSLDFHMTESSVVVGAPHANTSQPGVAQPGAVFLCSWPLDDPPCYPLLIDTTGAWTQNTLNLRTYKSHQWLGASVTSWNGKLVACAPLQHWNAMEGQHEAFRTPTGACFVGAPGLRRVAWYSPCRDRLMASTYRQSYYVDDKRYCEIGFSAAVTPVRRSLGGRRVRGAPGMDYEDGYRGERWARGCPTASSCQGTAGVTSARLPAGYSVAVGEFDGDSKTKGMAGGGAPQHPGPLPHHPHCPPSPHCPLPAPHPDPFQVASYFGHTVAVADVNGDGQDDVLVGAPLYMARRPDGHRSEVGRLYLYLGGGPRPLARPPQTLTGTHPYGRFSAAIASLGDLDKDGYGDVAVGAPLGGDGGSGQVFIFRGQSEGLVPAPTQLLDSPFRGPAAFGFALRGATDLDGNGYPDLLVGAHGVAKVAVYWGQPVVVARTQLSVPSGLNPELLECVLPDSSAHVSCFPVVLCVSVTGQHIPQSIRLDAELQLDRLKPRLSRRVLLLQGHQSSWHRALALTPGTPPLCHNLTAYLRVRGRCQRGLAGVGTVTSPTGMGTVAFPTHIILEDCGEDNLCVPDLHLAADTPSRRLLIGAEAALRLRANASNAGEGAFEAELRVQLPPGTHYQAARSSIPEKLSCNPRKENGSHVVLCELGNPMKAGARVRAWGVPGSGTITLASGLGAAGGGSPTHPPAAPPRSPVLHPWVPGGPSPPQCHLTVLPQLHNKGPSTVSEVTLHLAVPSQLGGRILLYLLELGTEGGMSCTNPPGLNRVLGGVRGVSPGCRGGGRRGDARHVPQDCGNATCVGIACRVPSLAKDQRALVTVHALLWMDTLQQHLLKQFLIHSRAWFNTSAMPYRIQPRVLPSGEAVTEVVRTSPGGEGAVPVWWVVLGVLAGLLLLTFLILLMWKVGFFKRTRPPAEDNMELVPGQGQEPGGAQG
uniref:Integrin subunit alpha 2b n=1 Tax=Otus sunia TaxID=257818 RepID=A0A8C8BEF1_9STRI